MIIQNQLLKLLINSCYRQHFHWWRASRAQKQLTLGDPNHPWAVCFNMVMKTTPYVATVLPAIVDSKTVVHTVGLGSANQASSLILPHKLEVHIIMRPPQTN